MDSWICFWISETMVCILVTTHSIRHTLSDTLDGDSLLPARDGIGSSCFVVGTILALGTVCAHYA